MVQKQTTKKGHGGEALAVSAGVAALAAASYYFLGPKGKQHRRHLKSWSIKMKGEVVEKLEKLKDVSEPVYREIVDAAAKKYAQEQGVAKADVDALAQELKRAWSKMTSSAKTGKRSVAQGGKKMKRKLTSKKMPARKSA